MNTIIGTWKLLSIVMNNAGLNHKPFGEKVTGLLIYHENGYMTGIISGENRPKISRPAMFGIPEEERLAISNHFIAYGGKYSIEEDTVSHEIMVSFVPNLMDGTPHRSKFSLADNQLIIKSEPIHQKDHIITLTLTWERVK